MKSKVLAAALLLCVLTTISILTERSDSGSARAQTPPGLPTLAIQPFVSGVPSPVGITHAGDGSGRVFIIQQAGRIRVVKNNALLPTPFLDITARVSCCGERGLLGLAFPPDYGLKGYFYVNYTNTAGNTVVSRFQRSAANADVADPASEQIVLTVAQPFANHNGGHMAFGPQDGQLYIAMGDGGSGGDPGNRAQNPLELLGKMLRIDVETGRPYTYSVHPTNPFATRADFRPEIWALGLRNPWRFSFDRQTADLFIGDVGQNNFEEIDFQPAPSTGGENYGWRIMEGAHCFDPPGCSTFGLTLPVFEYTHAVGCSVTGGYVYRGGEFPRMQGLYFYSDYCNGQIWALTRDGATWQNTLLLDTSINISSYGEDEAGNLYVASHNTSEVFRVVDTAAALPPTPTPTPAEIRFEQANISAPESQGSVQIRVVRTGDPAPDFQMLYATEDLTASEREDYTTAQGTLNFASGEMEKTFEVLITNDETDEGNEVVRLRLAQMNGGLTVLTGTAELTITDDDAATSAANPVDRSDFFVRQHYLDFLNREPDPEGLAFWVNGIESCGANNACRDVKRIDTSAAFFLSIEFQETGYFVYRLHKAAFGDLPSFRQFLADTQQISRGIVVGRGDWALRLERNKQAFVNEFVARQNFRNRFPTGQTPAQYVNVLDLGAGDALSQGEQDELARRLTAGQETRATALRAVAEDDDFEQAELNRAFVLMQYFGYLRRNPNDPPDTDFRGFDFWLDKLNDHNGDFRGAQMVEAFITSFEYRDRFR
ncbi:MAG TPA: PQQ-dependent sugar dehydrogenase [Pyrinomonadaceae bacterium]|nr:PQQ-dependent sugar dehydrogenase [Pyrinomonadaceae bacterium]